MKRNAHIGQYLQSLRKERKLALREVAEHIGIDVTMLSKIEHGDRQVQPHQLVRIVEFFNLDFKKLQIEYLIQKIHSEYGHQPFLKESLQKYLQDVTTSK